jgi:hypothetical protein
MTDKHTPGPWVLDGENADVSETSAKCVNIKAGDEFVLFGCGCCGSPSVDNVADLRLMLAAPEMYEAAMAVVTGDYELDRPGFNRALNRLRDALDMAEGRS